MKVLSNPVERIGSLHIKPNWRFDASQNPAKYKMQDFVSIPESNSGCLKRYLRAGLSYEVKVTMPPLIRECVSSLQEEKATLLKDMWTRSCKRRGRKKIDIDTNQTIFAQMPVWNLSVVEKINDDFFKRLVYHHSNIKFDRHIAKALEFGTSPEHNEIFRFMGYCIYAKVPDIEIARRWNIPLKQAEAIRMLYFDFSHFPKDRMANFSYLRQLTNIGLFDDTDFAYYKRVFELGEVGLKAHADFYSLTRDEKKIVEEYLGKTIIANTLNVNFSIKNQKDAINYGLVVSNLANYYIKEAEISYFGAKIKNLNVCTSRMESNMSDTAIGKTPLDNELIELLAKTSLQDDRPTTYKTLDALN